METDKAQSGGPPPAAPSAKAARAAEVLGEVLRLMGVPAKVGVREEGDNVALSVEPEGGGEWLGLRPGNRGPVLDALQVTVNRAVNRQGDARKFIAVDIGSFRQADDPDMAAMARRLADKVKEIGKPLAIAPMNPRDRRQVHLALAGIEGVTTHSEGEGLGRRLVVVPAAKRSSHSERSG